MASGGIFCLGCVCCGHLCKKNMYEMGCNFVIFILKFFFVMYDCVGGDSRLKIYSVY